MAVCVLPAADVGAGAVDRRDHGRIEELALPPGELSTSTMQRFLWACGVEPEEALSAMSAARETVRSGAAAILLRVDTDSDEPVEIRELEPASLLPAR